MSKERPVVIDIIKEFFRPTYRKDKGEYWLKLKPDHLVTLAKIIDTTITQNYMNPELVQQRLEPLATLNNELQNCLRTAVDYARTMKLAFCGTALNMDYDSSEKSWQKDLNTKLINIKKMIDALDLHDPKQKEQYDGKLKNSGD